MSVRNLDRIFTPSSIALVGASSRPGTVGTVTLSNVQKGSFSGLLYLVNPRHTSLNGLQVYPDVASLPESPDLAVLRHPLTRCPS